MAAMMLLLNLLLLLLLAGLAGAAGGPVNAQLYPCNASEPWRSRQRWAFAAPGPSSLALVASGSDGALQPQLPSPSLATTCPKEPNASCWNLVIGPAVSALQFELADSKLTVAAVGDGSPSHLSGLCLASSDSGTVSKSNGYLANIFLTECSTTAAKSTVWSLSPAGEGEDSGSAGAVVIKRGAPHASSGQCLDVGSGGSHGDLGFELPLLPAAPLEQQAFHSSEIVSWGGSVIKATAAEGGEYHMFAAVFSSGKGLSSWLSNSEIMHLQAKTPSGPFKPTSDGPNADGIVVQSEAHNPTVVRANDGTYLLFSIGKSPFLASKSVSGPWHAVKFASCNNPAPLVVPGREEVYVYCHGGPDMQHYGSSVGMLWTPHWSSGVWHIASNNTDDLHGNGRDLFAHPVEVSDDEIQIRAYLQPTLSDYRDHAIWTAAALPSLLRKLLPPCLYA
jgi:hypothetical protein